MRIAAFLFAVLVLSALARADKIEPAVYRQSADYIKVIIKAEENAVPLIASAAAEYESFNNSFYAANVSKNNLVFLENSPSVKKVWLDKKSKPLLDVSVLLIGTSEILPYYNGSGVKVCVIDTGINSTHPALASRIVAERDFITDDFDGNSTFDGANHGTHVAGIVAGNNDTYRGVAPGASILNAKVFQKIGSNWLADDGDIMAGIDWCISQGAHVLTLSLGGGDGANDGSDALSQYLDYAADQGKIVTVAAGNSGPSGGDSDCRTSDSTGSSFSICYPGLSHKAITVGSTQTGKSSTTKDAISGFSSRGPTKDGRIKPDIVAPGQPITSSVSSGGFTAFSGTSMATPHVAGVAALVLQARSNITPEEFKALIMNTANSAEKNNTYGAGRINVTHIFSEINNTITANIGNYSRAHNIFVPENSSAIIATLYWPENYSYHNNLDLLLLNPSGIQQNASLSVNNTDEKIVFANPQSGWWKLVVNGTYVNGTQKYALATNVAASPQLFFFNASSNATAYHELNVTGTTVSANIDWLGDARINATLYNSTGIFISSLLNSTRVNFSLAGESGLWTLKIILNQTTNYFITSSNALNGVTKTSTTINITNPRNGSYINSANVTVNFSLAQSVRTAQSCVRTFNNGQLNLGFMVPRTATSFSLTNLNDSSYKVNITCIDDSLASTTASESFIVDMIAPNISIISAESNFIRRNYTFVNVTVNETNPFRCFLEWDGTNETMNLSSNYCFINKSSSEGFHSYRIYVNDSASNSVYAGRNLTFDTKTPEAGIVFSGANGFTFSPNDDGLHEEITFNVTASETINFSTTHLVALNGTYVKTFQKVDNVTSILKTWNGCFIESCASGLVPDGSYKIEVKMTDRAGNVNASNVTAICSIGVDCSSLDVQTRTARILVDATYPQVSFASPTPNKTVMKAGNSIVVNVSLSEYPSSLFLEWNGTNESMSVSSSSSLNWFKTKTKLPDGNYTFKVYANDSGDNRNVSETRWVFINVTRNVTQVIRNISQTFANRSITFVFVNSTGHLADSGNLTSFENYTLRFNISRIIVETADFSVDAINSSALINLTDNITSEPNISSSFESAGGLLDSYTWVDLNNFLPPGNFTARITFPRVYALYFYLNGTKDAPNITRVSSSCYANFSNVPCYNISGNTSVLYLPSFSGGSGGNDTTAPSLVVSLPTATTYSSSSISLAFTASDNAALSNCWYRLNSGANTTLDQCANGTITAAQGSNVLLVHVNDTTGNENRTEVNFTYTAPLTTPSSSGSSSGGGSGPAVSANKTAQQNTTVSLAVTEPELVTINLRTVDYGTVRFSPTGRAASGPASSAIGLIVVIILLSGAYLARDKIRKMLK